jgi:tRNA(Ile)-lysidine synthase TilS/MesJ
LTEAHICFAPGSLMVLWENAGQKPASRKRARRDVDGRIWRPLCFIRAAESNRNFDILKIAVQNL